MIGSVPRHASSALASASAGGFRRHVDGLWQSVDGHDQLGYDEVDHLAGNHLVHVEHEAPVAPTDVLDAPKSGRKDIRHTEHLGEVLLLLHAGNLHRRPRANAASSAHVLRDASRSKFLLRNVRPYGYGSLEVAA